jgi:hypothetical protein
MNIRNKIINKHKALAKEALQRLTDKAQKYSGYDVLKEAAETAANNLDRERCLTDEKLNRQAIDLYKLLNIFVRK